MMNNPLAKINAVRKNKSFGRNHVDVLYAIILSVDNTTNEGYASYKTLMEDTRMSRGTLSTTLQDLRRAGIIIVIEQGSNISNQAHKYRLLTERLTEEVDWNALS